MQRRMLACALVGFGLLTAVLLRPAPGVAGAAARTPAAAQSPASVVPDDAAEIVTMKRNRFTPDFQVIAVGTTMTWRNEDSGPEGVHDVYAEDGSFNSPLIEPGESWSFTFTAEGYYQYFCDLHDDMEAAILVVPADDAENP